MKKKSIIFMKKMKKELLFAMNLQASERNQKDGGEILMSTYN